MTEPIVRIEGISKSFGKAVALQHLDLDIAPGEFVTFLGPSGCGKTTLLRALAQLAPIQSGQIEVPRDGEGHVGLRVVFQDPRLLPWLTVRGNIGFALQAAGVERGAWEGRMDPLLEVVGLSGVKDHYPRQLSGGMAQRVARSTAAPRLSAALSANNGK